MSNLLWAYISVEFLLLYCLPYHSQLAIAVHNGNETDRQALLEFKAGIRNDPLGVLRSWNSSIHFCQWQGVSCGRRHQRVVMLDLRNRGLTGLISPHIGNLSFLRKLYFDNNTFVHEIPQELGRLRRLLYLWLNNNYFTGEIPANISVCSDLIGIDLSYNKLRGTIPVEFGVFPKVVYLYLDNNNLIGSIPFSFGNLSSMEELFLGENNLTGIVPHSLGQLKNLQILGIFTNRLSGTLFPIIQNMSSLTKIDVSNNQLEGSLPSNFPHLSFLSIGYNQFTGSLPSSVSNMSNLEYLMMSKNFLTGKIPDLKDLQRLRRLSAAGNHLGNGGDDDLSFISDLTNATDLESLAMSYNAFAGVLPKSLGNLSTSLVLLHLDNNQISGIVPYEIANLFNLEQLVLWNNKLKGSIPIVVGKLRKLSYLRLDQNRFIGNIPSSLGNLSMAIRLDLNGNNLQGRIPSSLGNCQNLLGLDLSDNKLDGTIPHQILSILSLSWYLYLYSNLFTASLPTQVGNLINLRDLDVSYNMLSGGIPSSLSHCVLLEILHMEGNFLEGTIPPSFSSMRGLQHLDLSNNSLSGEIPEYFGDFNLISLNLSFNNFSGSLPENGIFNNVSAIAVFGNLKLCGGIPDLHLPKCHLTGSKNHGFTHVAKLVVSLVLGVLALITAFVVLFLFWFRRKVKRVPTTESIGNSLLNVTYHSLLQATSGFNEANLLSFGSFGSVFKGILDPDGTVVAVKVLNILHHGAARSFMAECETLRNIRHRNLVKVLSACSGIDYKGNDFKALLYEYMANGSLEDWLHPVEGQEVHVNLEQRNLCLFQRLSIAIDVASALDYLHNHCEMTIVHCDLKPSNVLLDDDFIGHVGDFGLARILFEDGQPNTNTTSSLGVRGSVGYTAPEYGMGSKVSTHGDVYSFGILLLEMFTSKRPTDDIFQNGLNLCTFVADSLPDRLEDIVDPVILREIEEANTGRHSTRTSRFRGFLTTILEIGLSCSIESAKDRTSTGSIVSKLRSVKNVILQT